MAVLPLLVTLALVSASPEPLKLASPGLTGVNLAPDILRFYSDHLAQQLGFHHLRVTTESEIQQLLGFERQRQLLGCANDSTTCLAELANALGVDGMVNGSIGRVGRSYQINIKIISAQDGTPLAAFSRKVRDEEEVLDTLSDAAGQMSAQLFAKLGRPAEGAEKTAEVRSAPQEATSGGGSSSLQEESSPAPRFRRFAWIPLAGGVVFAGVGVALNRSAWAHANEVENHPEHFADESAAQAYLNQGKALHALSLASFGVSVVGAAAAGAMWFGLFGGTPVQVAVVPGSSPAVSVAGRF